MIEDTTDRVGSEAEKVKAMKKIAYIEEQHGEQNDRKVSVEIDSWLVVSDGELDRSETCSNNIQGCG